MERLKRVIRQALSENAHRIKLQVGTEFEVLAQQGIRMMPDGDLIDDAYLQLLYKNLMPAELARIQRQELTKGVITIPNVGNVNLIASSAPPASLRIYLPPRGEEMFASDWGRLSASQTSLPNDKFVGTNAHQVPVPDWGTSAAAVFQEPQPSQTQLRSRPLQGSGLPADLFALPPDLEPEQAAASTPRIPLPKPRVDPVENGLLFIPPEPEQSPRMAEGIPEFIPPLPSFAATNESPPPSPPGDDLESLIRSQVSSLAEPAKVRPNHEWSAPASAYEGGAEAPQESAKIQFAPESQNDFAKSDEKPLDSVLRHMVQLRASDVHLTCSEPICVRIDGEITRLDQFPVEPAQMEQYLVPIMPQKNIKEFLLTNDTDFAYELQDAGRFRVNIYRDKNGVGAVIRHIPSKILTAEQLNLPPAITKFCHLSKGLVVVTGPTGSGKSTTLAAMVDLINKTRADHILTIEDPVEFVHPQQRCLVNQREVHRHTTSFARALKAALREDPDIILIGEMRDLETVAIAIETAETGHLVFGTLHTTTAVSTVDRIIDQFPADRQAQIRTMLASSLKGVVAQTLLKKKGGGRVAAHEILVLNDAVSAMIREGKIHMVANHMQTQKADGNILLNESLLRLVKEGLVDPDDAVKKAVDKVSLIDALRRANLIQPSPPTPQGKPSGQRSA